MQKLIVITNEMAHYRIPFYNSLSDHFDLVVFHSTSTLQSEIELKFESVYVKKCSIGPFFYQNKVVTKLLNNRGDVLLMFDLRYVSSLIAYVLIKIFTKRKVILWGAWLTDSKLANFVRTNVMKHNRHNLFYTKSAMQDFVNSGVSAESCFIANNTFDVKFDIVSVEFEKKDLILFVGSLNPRKGLIQLLENFASSLDKIPETIKLCIIGSGSEHGKITSRIKELGIQERVDLIPALNTVHELSSYYRRALVSVSLKQAGLSVLQSFGFGVPFITSETAISGGEKTNIIDGYNGFLLKNDSQLSKFLIKISVDKNLSEELSINAHDYYQKYCTIDNMVNGVYDCIHSTKKTKIYPSQEIGK